MNSSLSPIFDYLKTKAKLNVVEITSQEIRSRSSSTESINSDSKSQQRHSKSYSLDMGNKPEGSGPQLNNSTLVNGGPPSRRYGNPSVRDEPEKPTKRPRQNTDNIPKESKEKPFKISPQDVAKIMENGNFSSPTPKFNPNGGTTKRLGKTTYETFPDPPNKLPGPTSTKSHPTSFPNKNPRPSKPPLTKDYMDTSNLPAPKSHSLENLSISTSSSTGSSSNSDSPQLRVPKNKSDPFLNKREKKVKTKPLPLKKELGSRKKKQKSKNKKDQ